jgi:hypothetical protein
MPEELMEKGLSRKRLLKRAGAGAAVLMAAPVLTSSAQALHGGRHTCGKSGDCFANGGCNGIGCRPPDPNCYCFPTTGPNPRCHCIDLSASIFCADYADCAPEAPKCPEGFRCVNSCCGVGKCVPPCGDGGAAGITAKATSGPTLISR